MHGHGYGCHSGAFEDFGYITGIPAGRCSGLMCYHYYYLQFYHIIIIIIVR